VRIAAIDAGNWTSAVRVRVTPEQVPLVTDHEPIALVILAKAYVRPDDRDWEPLAFVDDTGRVLGVTALVCDDERCEIRHFAIDAAHQGRGVGYLAMTALIEHVKRSRRLCRELVLTVHPDNDRAQRLYSRAGLVHHGAYRDGQPIFTLTLERGRHVDGS
jgi:RimJ/RimL family protein N-acetyltransferase